MIINGKKRCPDCDKQVPIAKFGKRTISFDGLAPYCLIHANDRLRKYNAADPNRAAKRRAYRANNADIISAIDKRKREKVKREFLAAYGWVCACCKEANEAFLTIDHINNDGEKHRKSLKPNRKRGGNSYAVYQDLKKKGWPSYVRILCFNCNFGRRGRGECPHKLQSTRGGGRRLRLAAGD